MNLIIIFNNLLYLLQEAGTIGLIIYEQEP